MDRIWTFPTLFGTFWTGFVKVSLFMKTYSQILYFGSPWDVFNSQVSSSGLLPECIDISSIWCTVPSVCFGALRVVSFLIGYPLYRWKVWKYCTFYCNVILCLSSSLLNLHATSCRKLWKRNIWMQDSFIIFELYIYLSSWNLVSIWFLVVIHKSLSTQVISIFCFELSSNNVVLW